MTGPARLWAALRAGLTAGVLACMLLTPPAFAQTEGGASPDQSSPPATGADGAATAPSEQAGPAVTTTTTPSTTAPRPGVTVTVSKGSGRSPAVDYAEWERAAARAEQILTNPDVSNEALEELRAQIVDRRATFLLAQNTNSSRIATLREQIAALGPAPAEGEPEAEEIVLRRQQLGDQLVKLQAPGITADEAYRRADGMIGEIDRILRERQADQLLQLWPAPINPANWPAAAVAIKDVTVRVWSESSLQWRRDGRDALFDNLPLILLLTVAGLGIIWKGRALIVRLTSRVTEPKTARGRRVVALLLSLGQVILPTLGVYILSVALTLTGLTGAVGGAVIAVLPWIGFSIFAANWLGSAVFPLDDRSESAFLLSTERRAEGRFLARTIGLLLGLEALRLAIMAQVQMGETAAAVLSFPVLAAAAVLVFRMGQLLSRHAARAHASEEGSTFGTRVLGLMARGAMVVGAAGLLLGAVGYIAAASAAVYPAAATLGMVALLFVLQRLVADLYGLATRSDAADQEGLIPVLIGFAMTIASIPLFALIWGARMADITELWQRFLEGFQIGNARVSPTDFLIFAIIFAAGYTLTRLMQGALKGTVLPRTSLDQGGQNAVVSGVGYVGIFLAALIAINAAGIDLSGLAIVAGALSVGIGFGLQNIVSNFVSGIILLIERPVSEGDWIEVGNVQGTVKSISVRSTRIQTFDRSDVIVPNSDLVSGRVTNWTRFNLSGRLIVPVTVLMGSDTRKVEAILRSIAEAQPLAVLNPPPVVAFMGFAPDAMLFEIRVILRDVNFSLQVRSEINHAIVTRFAEAGIEMPHTKVAAAALPPAAVEAALDPPKRAKRLPRPSESTDPTLREAQ
jgi:potassium-dependent mechanosensitive channel